MRAILSMAWTSKGAFCAARPAAPRKRTIVVLHSILLEWKPWVGTEDPGLGAGGAVLYSGRGWGGIVLQQSGNGVRWLRAVLYPMLDTIVLQIDHMRLADGVV